MRLFAISGDQPGAIEWDEPVARLAADVVIVRSGITTLEVFDVHRELVVFNGLRNGIVRPEQQQCRAEDQVIRTIA